MQPSQSLKTFVLIMFLACSHPLFAQDIPVDPVGARHMALGGPAAAMTYGTDAVYHNPASLVWQTLTFGGGIQPIQWTEAPRSWWFALYNKNSDFDVPVSLIGQGWWAQTRRGDHYVNMVGMPLGFNFTPATPGAATLKFAAERDSSGEMTYGFPIDLGFLGRHQSGFVMGLVLRNLTIGSNPFEVLKERLDYGLAYGGGPLMVMVSTSSYRKTRIVDFKEQYRVGVEMFGNELVTLRGGYIQESDRWFATGGIGLRTTGDRQYEFSYSLLFDPEGKRFRHFVQYIFLLF